MFKNDLLLIIFYKSKNLFERLNCFQAFYRKTILIINYYTHTKEKTFMSSYSFTAFLDKKNCIHINIFSKGAFKSVFLDASQLASYVGISNRGRNNLRET